VTRSSRPLLYALFLLLLEEKCFSAGLVHRSVITTTTRPPWTPWWWRVSEIPKFTCNLCTIIHEVRATVEYLEKYHLTTIYTNNCTKRELYMVRPDKNIPIRSMVASLILLIVSPCVRYISMLHLMHTYLCKKLTWAPIYPIWYRAHCREHIKLSICMCAKVVEHMIDLCLLGINLNMLFP
jgi:hypothetical protein